jgi:hypothetical protein
MGRDLNFFIIDYGVRINEAQMLGVVMLGLDLKQTLMK